MQSKQERAAFRAKLERSSTRSTGGIGDSPGSPSSPEAPSPGHLAVRAAANKGNDGSLGGLFSSKVLVATRNPSVSLQDLNRRSNEADTGAKLLQQVQMEASAMVRARQLGFAVGWEGSVGQGRAGQGLWMLSL